MSFFVKRAIGVALCALPLQAQTFFGHTMPGDSLARITGDHTVNGVEFVAGVSGTLTLTMTDADTLVIVGSADLSGVTLSDSSAGVIVVGAYRDTSGMQIGGTLEVGSAQLNHLWFSAPGLGGNGAPNIVLSGDSLVVNGDMVADNGFNQITIGGASRPLSITTMGAMKMFSTTGRTNSYGGRFVVHGDFAMNVWWAYHGTRNTVIEFAGAGTQNVKLTGRDDRVVAEEYGTIVHSGEGVMRLIGRGMVCDSFIQTAGTLDLNGFFANVDVMELAGALENELGWSDIRDSVFVIDSTFDTTQVWEHDTTWDTSYAVVSVDTSYDTVYAGGSGVIQSIDTLHDTLFDTASASYEIAGVDSVEVDSIGGPYFAYDTLYDTTYNANAAMITVLGRARFVGSVDSSETTWVDLNPAWPWSIKAHGSVMANYAKVGGSTVTPEFARALAYNSIDEGGNTGWDFTSGGSALSRKLPDSLVVLSGDAVTLRVAAVLLPGDDDLVVRWMEDSVSVGSGETLVLTPSATPADDGRTFTVYLKGPATTVDSAGPMKLIVLDRPRLEDKTYGGTALVGETLKLSVNRLAGVDRLQWYLVVDTGQTAEFAAVEGATSDTLVLDSVARALHNQRFAAVAYDTNATAFEPDTVIGTIRVYFPLSITGPQSVAAVAGDNVMFAVSVETGWTGALTYQWYENGKKMVLDSNETVQRDTLILTGVSAAMIGNKYKVQVTGDGGRRYTSTEATIEQGVGLRTTAAKLPVRFSFGGIAPNPVRGAACVRFALPVPARVTLSVYSLKGRLIARLVDDLTPAGFHAVAWDGTNERGEPIAPGQYVLRIRADNKVRQQQISVMR